MGELVTVRVPISQGYHGESWLLETTYIMDFLPDVGEHIHPLKKDTESGLTFAIKNRYWDEKGRVILEIGKYIIDPEDDGEHLPRPWNSWYTDRDGDLVQKLLANGWWHYQIGMES